MKGASMLLGTFILEVPSASASMSAAHSSIGSTYAAIALCPPRAE